MKVLITGGRGFVGQNLSRFLLDKGCEVVSISRSAIFDGIVHPRFQYLSADTIWPGEWQNEVRHADVIVNLTGTNIFHYWTKKYKKSIYDSRIQTTRNLVNVLPEGKEQTLISTSAMGYYGDRGDDNLKEEEPAGDDFLAKVCSDWESEALKAKLEGIRTAIVRFAVVADKSGGAMKMMIPPFRFFVGGPLGNGKQWFPWIHLSDLISGIWHIIENKNLDGIFNFCAPEPIRNKEMSRVIGNLLHRPSLFTVPGFAIRLAIGELGSMVLYSQRGAPENLIKSGFEFQYPEFKKAMEEILL
jgi:uncharacterized protein